MDINTNPSERIRASKLDQTPYLFHFIKGKPESAKNDLMSILYSGQIYSRSDNDHICFSASPVTQLGTFFQTLNHNTNQPIYQPYGIAFPRDIMIQHKGARNVIYGGEQECKELVKAGFGWRSMILDVNSSYWEWLREWRTYGKVFDFKSIKDHILIITRTQKELLDIAVNVGYMESFDYDPTTGEEYLELVETYDRKWKGVSIESIVHNDYMNDYQLREALSQQQIGEDMFDDVAEQHRKDTARLNALIAKENAWLFETVDNNV